MYEKKPEKIDGEQWLKKRPKEIYDQNIKAFVVMRLGDWLMRDKNRRTYVISDTSFRDKYKDAEITAGAI